MAECYCLGCGEIFEDGEKARLNDYGEPEMDGDLCPSCCEAIEVGRLVMKMPPSSGLCRAGNGAWNAISLHPDNDFEGKGETVLEALKEGIKND